jgi:hypothetical protein
MLKVTVPSLLMTGDCTLAWLKSFSWAFAVAQPNAKKIAVFVIIDEF